MLTTKTVDIFDSENIKEGEFVILTIKRDWMEIGEKRKVNGLIKNVTERKLGVLNKYSEIHRIDIKEVTSGEVTIEFPMIDVEVEE